MHRTTERFWECYSNLPRDIQELADKSFRLLQDNPRHPSLHFKKVGGFRSGAGPSLSSSGLRAVRRLW
ncbi:MAG: hypothetical protein EA424_00970 [Planctomycetaceae bacterium]|nr:MAG: hypothetical protein EA424_00970 [Planctomycetaceae bacterium]